MGFIKRTRAESYEVVKSSFEQIKKIPSLIQIREQPEVETDDKDKK